MKCLNNFKRILFSLLMWLISSSLYSQDFACYYDGYWGNWRPYAGYEFHIGEVGITGSYKGFAIYKRGDHPSKYFFNFDITGYAYPSKKDIKQHYKTNTWWVYNGIVEYYVCDVYPTLKDCMRQFKRLLVESDAQGTQYQEKLSLVKASQISQTGRFNAIGFKKVSKNATIKIAPYKEHPKVYNIYIDDVGYAIDLDNLYWKE